MQIILIVSLIIVLIILAGFYFMSRVEETVEENGELDSIIKDYRTIKVAMMEYKKEEGALPTSIKELGEFYKAPLNRSGYSLSVDRKHLIVYSVEETRAESIIRELGTDSYYEGGILYLGFIKLKRSEVEPQAIITMMPDVNLTTTTQIGWNYKESITEDGAIKDVVWENKKIFYDEPGEHIVRLKIQDSNKNWSKWAEKVFLVQEEQGVKEISAGENCFFVLLKNGNCLSYFLEENGEYERYEPFEGYSIQSIDAGDNHILFGTYDQRIFAMGNNKQGQLGDGTLESSNELIRVENLYDAKRVFAGGSTSMALCFSGKLYAWGNNKYGQLGNGTVVAQNQPSEVKNIIGVKEVAVGMDHTVALLINGNIMSWGLNNHGQLGDGTRGNKKAPVLIGLKACKDIAVGDYFSLALTDSGQVYSWGKNDEYQLGKNNKVDESFPTEIRGLIEIVQVCASGEYGMALDRFGKVYVWGSYEGNNVARQPKLVDEIEHVQFIAINETHVFTITYNGEVIYWKKGKETKLHTL
ncbi:MAG: hypothetical protein N4A40_06575 [Tissierellales bacterium]|nr:hypothetical protein [Tissierellales bacterium]